MALRLTAALLALAGGVAAAALAALLLHGTPGPVSVAPAAPPPAPAPPPAARGFPAPPAGAVVFSREDGPNALALAILPGRVQVSVVGPQGTGVDGLDVRVDGVAAHGCGPGCYAARGTPPVDVQVGSTRWRVAVPPHTPDASSLVGLAARTWLSLRSLSFSDRLGSDATHVVYSTWSTVAPDRLSYRVRGGSSAVIVGDRRWDRAPGGKWVESPQLPVSQPRPLWVAAVDAHIVGETAKAWRVTFFDPRTPAWFDITVDKRTMRTLDARMVATAHFMHERYGDFDAPLTIVPPTSP